MVDRRCRKSSARRSGIRGLTHVLGGDTEYVHSMRPLNTHALMWGLPVTPATEIHGYKTSVRKAGSSSARFQTRRPKCPGMDGFLRLNEMSYDVVLLMARTGPEELRKMAERASRERVHILEVELSDQKMYLSESYGQGSLYPPLKVAYDHPDHPKLPSEAFADRLVQIDALARQDALMKYFSGVFVPANVGSRFVSERRPDGDVAVRCR